MESKSLQLIYIYSHDNEDKEKKGKNEKKFNLEAAIQIHNNNRTNALVKKGMYTCSRITPSHVPTRKPLLNISL